MPRSSCSGYVLLEALLSVILLSIGLVAVMQAVGQAVRVVQYQKSCLAPARVLADSLLASLEIGFTPEVLAAAGPTTGERGRFRYQIASAPWPAATELRDVRVTVSWVERGKPGELSLTTLLSVVDERQIKKNFIESLAPKSIETFRNVPEDENRQ